MQACCLCDAKKALLSSSHACHTAQVKYMSLVDAHREDVIKKTVDAGFPPSEYYRCKDALDLASELGVRPNCSGLKGFGLQPTFSDINETKR